MTPSHYDYDVITCVVEKDGERFDVLATVIKGECDEGNWMSFALETPFTVLEVDSIPLRCHSEVTT